MKIRLHVENFEIEIGGTRDSSALSNALAPALMMFLSTYAHKLWAKEPPKSPPPDDPEVDDAESDGRHVVDGAAAPESTSPAAAEV